jgi:hypothetical protein
MPTAHKAISSIWTAVAQGPGEVIFSLDEDYGRFAIHTSTDPSGITTSGHKQPPEVPFVLTLESGEVLHLRGRGSATVSAKTLV